MSTKKKKKKKQPKPRITLFSINPKTGEPYLEVKHAQNMIKYHVLHHIPFILKLQLMEDIVQAVLTKMCIATYKPKKSAPKTYALRIIQTQTYQIMDTSQTKKRSYDSDEINPKTGKVRRNPIIPFSGDIRVAGSHEDQMSLFDLQPDDIDPEHTLLAKEIVKQIKTATTAERAEILKALGYGYNHLKADMVNKVLDSFDDEPNEEPL